MYQEQEWEEILSRSGFAVDNDQTNRVEGEALYNNPSFPNVTVKIHEDEHESYYAVLFRGHVVERGTDSKVLGSILERCPDMEKAVNSAAAPIVHDKKINQNDLNWLKSFGVQASQKTRGGWKRISLSTVESDDGRFSITIIDPTRRYKWFLLKDYVTGKGYESPTMTDAKSKAKSLREADATAPEAAPEEPKQAATEPMQDANSRPDRTHFNYAIEGKGIVLTSPTPMDGVASVYLREREARDFLLELEALDDKVQAWEDEKTYRTELDTLIRTWFELKLATGLDSEKGKISKHMVAFNGWHFRSDKNAAAVLPQTMYLTGVTYKGSKLAKFTFSPDKSAAVEFPHHTAQDISQQLRLTFNAKSARIEER